MLITKLGYQKMIRHSMKKTVIFAIQSFDGKAADYLPHL